MSLSRRSMLLAFSCAVANAAGLVPVPTPPPPSLPVVGLEANKGQAKTGILFLSRGNGDTDVFAAGNSIAATAQGVLYSPRGATLGLVAENVEYAGAAPTQLSGVTQINVTLPDVIPASYPPGTLHLSVVETGVPFFSATVTMYVSGN